MSNDQDDDKKPLQANAQLIQMAIEYAIAAYIDGDLAAIKETGITLVQAKQLADLPAGTLKGLGLNVRRFPFAIVAFDSAILDLFLIHQSNITADTDRLRDLIQACAPYPLMSILYGMGRQDYATQRALRGITKMGRPLALTEAETRCIEQLWQATSKDDIKTRIHALALAGVNLNSAWRLIQDWDLSLSGKKKRSTHKPSGTF